MFTEIEGDLFDLGLPAIGHGVNLRGMMGAGIARVFRSKYPDMYHAYTVLCSREQIPLGGIMVWQAPNVMIYNLASQREPGADASLEAVESSVRLAVGNCQASGIPKIGFPRIGCGIGGLEWADVRAIMEKVSQEFPGVEVVAVTLPGTGA